MNQDGPRWYILRTKRHKELFVKTRVSTIVEKVYLPVFIAKRRYLDAAFNRIEPLFPGYVFAFFSVADVLSKLQRCEGVAGIVCAGVEPCEVSSSIIEQIKDREREGVIVLNEAKLHPLQPVSITGGPFQGIEGVFERYLKSAERVAVLLNSVRGGNVRVVLSTTELAPADSCHTA